MPERDDASAYCETWSDRVLHEAIEGQLTLAIAAPSPGRRLGYLSGARALIGILADRAEAEAKEASE